MGISKNNVFAMVDTGACRSLVAQSVVRDNGLLKDVIPCNEVKLITAGNHELMNLGKVMLPLCIAERDCPHEFIIVEDKVVPTPVLLGTDFLRRIEASVRFDINPPHLVWSDRSSELIVMSPDVRPTLVVSANSVPFPCDSSIGVQPELVDNVHASQKTVGDRIVQVECEQVEREREDAPPGSAAVRATQLCGAERDCASVPSGAGESEKEINNDISVKCYVQEISRAEGWSCGVMLAEMSVKNLPEEVEFGFFNPTTDNTQARVLCPGLVRLERGANRKLARFAVPYINAERERVFLEAGRPIGRFEPCLEAEFGTVGTRDDEAQLIGAIGGLGIEDRVAEREVAAVKERETVDFPCESSSGVRDKVMTITSEERKQKLTETVDRLFPVGTQENTELRKLVQDYPQAFSLADEPLTVTPNFYHEIVTDGPVVYRKPYPIPIKHHEEVKRQVNELVKQGIVRPSRSPYNSPLVPVVKKDGGLRLCLDFRALNKQIEDDRFPLPHIQTILAQLGKSEYFTCLDLRQGYHQIPLTEDSCHKTAFSTPDGSFEYCSLPFGLKDACSAFQRIITQALTGLIGQVGFVYLDDIVVTGRDWAEHVANLKQVLGRLEVAQLSLKLEKCVFFKKEVSYLGHLISPEGIRPLEGKLRAVREFPQPHDLRTLQSFLGLTNYYRRFVADYARIAKPLARLTECKKSERKGSRKIEWNEEAERAFHLLKQKLMEDIVLAFPDFSKPFMLTTDASDFAIGGVLQQPDDQGRLRPLSFFSRSLTGPECNYSALDREALAIVYGLKINRTLILGFPVRVATDHRPLTWLFSTKDASGRIARWQMLVSEFDIIIDYIPGRENVVADAMSRIRLQAQEAIIAAVSARDDRGENDGANADLNEVEWDLSELKREQDVHPMWGELKRHLQGEDTVPLPKLPLPVEQFKVLSDGLLYRLDRSAYDEERWQVIVPESHIDAALRLAHCLPISGHGGFQITRARLERFAYWPQIVSDVKKFIQKCQVCVRFKPSKDAPAPLQRYPDVDHPFQRVHMDLMGPLNCSTSGFKYILTVIDALTRYLIAVPLRSKEAREVAQAFVKNVVCRHGTPVQLVTDQGGEFVNDVLRGVSESLQVRHLTTTPYHPSANGLVERVNGTVGQILRTLVADNPSFWEEMLDFAVMAYNSGYNRSVKESPYYLLYHRDPSLPYETMVTEAQPWYNVDDYKAQLAITTNRVLHRCQTFLEDAWLENERRRKAVAKVKAVRVGDRVYVKAIPKPGCARKLQPLFSGPYRVLERKGDVVVVLRHIRNGKVCTLHTDRIRVVPEESMAGTDHCNVRRAYPVHDLVPADTRAREDYQPQQRDDRQGQMEDATGQVLVDEGPVSVESENGQENGVASQDPSLPSSTSSLCFATPRSRYALRSRQTVKDFPQVMGRPLEYEVEKAGETDAPCPE